MSKSSSTYASTGIGIGSALAICMSWTTWGHIGWAILHGLLGWIYVIYYACTYM